ncbi:NAD-dependent epimerase/dehydratase [Thecamonas trahens ATCC 50062]|uniref:NAD-dependent epimerase/dehydratase n=1 Tax=Thecamonas trahens ATCC 50062 TaxID=461836 RepID=A0A0L0DEQ6_THETB|nr:NAD-dependent epimerase/dehydratase [Thecamonas trahens ATCC 50062]KNC50621.1 NAD-dependent epimerase/dehydratase [Thecamonas trahens ATCC 50062]|eukprot:XP_013762508.1 NAD-dependent epimerase/dehydratase [Thecamonas trahens ATCC 50062]
MHAAVTGGTGFLGANLAQVLEASDAVAQVTVFGLPGSETQYLAPCAKATFVAGDITDAEDVAAALAPRPPPGGGNPVPIDVVFHLCGDTSFWKPLYARQAAINIGGTRNVIAAARAAGIPRLIHTSTADVELEPMPADYNYGETKREAEAEALAADSPLMCVVALRPGMLVGPYDFTLQFGRLFINLAAGDVPAIPCGGTSVACVRAVAAAHLAAATAPADLVGGRAFALGGHNVSYAEVFAAIARRVEVPPPRCVLPQFALVGYAWVVELWATWVSRVHPELNPGQARYMSISHEVDSSGAAAALGYTVPTLDDILDSAHEWYVANGFM